MLHIVDLDGAKNGKLANLEVIKQIAHDVSIPIQIGGGIRNKNAVEILLSIGVYRVILGTVALENEEELKNIIKVYASQVAIALDTKNGKLMTQGWLENSDKKSVVSALKFKSLGVQRFIYTDVIKDGTLTEPNYEEIASVIKKVHVPIIASGGISTIASIKQLQSIGAEGVIIGKALYEKKIDLKEAIYAS
jgi:phosphoribosylformimino-5-aminoimidazole carboxamide ribotide isomerase